MRRLRAPEGARRVAVATITAPAQREVTLDLEGMTCAACAARIERRLNRIDGVEATVNYATERATVQAPAGMADRALVQAVEAAGYGAHVPGRQAAAVTAARPVSGVPVLLAAGLALPIAVLSMVPGAGFSGWEWVAFALAGPVVFVSGRGFHLAALRSARHGTATMDTLISLGTLAAFCWSAVVLVVDLDAHVYFEVAAVVTALILFGRWLETRARRESRGALQALLQHGARETTLVRDGRESVIPVTELRVGDVFLVRPGETVAADGVVLEGESALDLSVLTGESVPTDVETGADVAGGSVNTYGRLVVRATRIGADAALGRIARLLEHAQTGKAPVQRLADRVSAVFVPIVIALALATLAGWLLAGRGAGDAFTAAVAVLIIACPCALGLATPTALLAGTGRGAELGLLIRGPEVLELARRVDTIVFDKTGTLTEGALELVEVAPRGDTTREEILRLAGAVESASEHPVGRAVAKAARAELGTLPAVAAFRSLPGQGVTGAVDGRAVTIGRGASGIEVSWEGAVRGMLAVRDTVRPAAPAAVAELRALGLDLVMLTGDTAETAEQVARDVGITSVSAGLLPEDKLREIRRLQLDGHVVAMVGDGINDAAALAQADLGLAMGSGTDVAIEAGEITLASGGLAAAPDAIRLARRTLGTIRVNLVWAFAYNVAALPLAAFGLLEPIIAAAAMAASSLFVVTNSLRLRRFRPRRTGGAI
ncbi:MAG: heavy metal translocating P-type ATPase [Gaiella sp.]